MSRHPLLNILTLTIAMMSFSAQAQLVEISGSPFDTEGAPMPQHIQTGMEKVVLVDPNRHAWGAYNSSGRLLRWGIATAGAHECADRDASCRTNTGEFRLYSLGGSDCISSKYDGAPMPYCMYFSGGQALHGSSDVEFNNISHGCVRMHVDDAKWLRYHFVDGPTMANNFRGTKVIIRHY